MEIKFEATSDITVKEERGQTKATVTGRIGQGEDTYALNFGVAGDWDKNPEHPDRQRYLYGDVIVDNPPDIMRVLSIKTGIKVIFEKTLTENIYKAIKDFETEKEQRRYKMYMDKLSNSQLLCIIMDLEKAGYTVKHNIEKQAKACNTTVRMKVKKGDNEVTVYEDYRGSRHYAQLYYYVNGGYKNERYTKKLENIPKLIEDVIDTKQRREEREAHQEAQAKKAEADKLAGYKKLEETFKSFGLKNYIIKRAGEYDRVHHIRKAGEHYEGALIHNITCNPDGTRFYITGLPAMDKTQFEALVRIFCS